LEFNNTDGSVPIETDMSSIPQLGGAWGTLPKGDFFQYGLECSFLLGFKFDEVNYASLGGGANISISTSMWMFDLAGGPYVNLRLTDNLRVYGGIGPLMVYADYQSEREETGGTEDGTYDNSESAFGLGAYARAGFEFRIHQQGMLGLGVRGNWSDVDFSDVGGTSDISGIAAFVTYTAGL
jgi:opacity protein-like surface antigen